MSGCLFWTRVKLLWNYLDQACITNDFLRNENYIETKSRFITVFTPQPVSLFFNSDSFLKFKKFKSWAWWIPFNYLNRNQIHTQNKISSPILSTIYEKKNSVRADSIPVPFPVDPAAMLNNNFRDGTIYKPKAVMESKNTTWRADIDAQVLEVRRIL
jgi:hypothetical protein